MVLTRVLSTFVEQGSRMIKLLRFGKDDIQEADNVAPFGIDSTPPKDMIAVFSDTTVHGDPVVVGYFNEHLLSKIGELRLYSTTKDGKTLKSFIHLKNDGTIELNGASDNLVRYKALNESLQNLISQTNQELAKIQSSISTLGGAYARVVILQDFTSSKIDNLKST